MADKSKCPKCGQSVSPPEQAEVLDYDVEVEEVFPYLRLAELPGVTPVNVRRDIQDRWQNNDCTLVFEFRLYPLDLPTQYVARVMSALQHDRPDELDDMEVMFQGKSHRIFRLWWD